MSRLRAEFACGRRCSLVRRFFVVLVLTLVASSATAAVRVELGPGAVASYDGETIVVEALPGRGEGLWAFAERWCGSASAAPEIAAANRGTRRLLAGVRYRVPWSVLSDDHRARALEALFPGDRRDPRGWLHRVGEQTRSLWGVAELFTESGENYRRIRNENQLEDETVDVGQELLIPRDLLKPVLRRLLPPAPVRVASTGAAPPLTYGSDAQGEYAQYRLREGEALYSSVVVRFTGRLFAEDVNPLAAEIARRSGVRDVTDIPIGYGIKIPLDYLAPEFLPSSHPRRQEWERNRAESAQFLNEVRALDLAGVHVVLDAGHGGRDIGASPHGVWESLYVYDIVMRIRQVLESTTAAKVSVTTRDGDSFEIQDRDQLPFSYGHSVLTTPPYAIQEARVGTTLRWYLANSIFEQARRDGVDQDRVIFISVHADSLHPSLRGAMVYVPGLLPMKKGYGKTGSIYTSRKEVREQQRVTFSRSERVRSEGLSRDLAGRLIQGFRHAGLAVHPNVPVRDRIIGRGRPWVPAVIRYNKVPAKVLLEVCNLANAEDRRLIQTRAYRQKVAEALVDGILSYYGLPSPRGTAPVQTAGR